MVIIAVRLGRRKRREKKKIRRLTSARPLVINKYVVLIGRQHGRAGLLVRPACFFSTTVSPYIRANADGAQAVLVAAEAAAIMRIKNHS